MAMPAGFPVVNAATTSWSYTLSLRGAFFAGRLGADERSASLTGGRAGPPGRGPRGGGGGGGGGAQTPRAPSPGGGPARRGGGSRGGGRGPGGSRPGSARRAGGGGGGRK